MITGKNQIGNQLSSNGDKTYRTFNPQLNLENEAVFYEATSSEIDQAVQLASDANWEFKKTTGQQRAEFLSAIADEILE